MMLLTLLLDAHSGGIDYGAIIGGGAAVISGGGWVKMLTDKATMKQEIKNIRDTEIKSLKEKLVEVTASKKALKKELQQEIKDKDETLHKRIDKTQANQKEHKTEVAKEFKEISEKLGSIQGGIGEIKGMIGK